jgi:DNA-binding NtrC family response regulator
MEPSKARVLVVDDDPSLLSLLVDTLQAIGYAVSGAQGGIAALELLQNSQFDLMVTDIKMPDLDGIQLLKKTRRHYPNLPVLFITGFATPDMIVRAAPDGYLLKPFRISHIEELIERTLKSRDSETARHMRKVLVVDPDGDFQESLIEALSFSQFIPFVAADSAHALQELELGSFDAIIADIADPGVTRERLPETMHQKYPQTPIIAIGTEDLSPDQLQLPSALFAAYIRKPFAVGSILHVLDEIAPSES